MTRFRDRGGRRRPRRCGARPRPATARQALAALDRHRLLCAHREGPYGVGGWNRLVERLVAERTGVTHYDEWYAGRPVLVTANDYGQRLYNGDIGATVRRRRRPPAGGGPGGRRRCASFATTRLPDVRDGARDDGAQVAGLAGRRRSAWCCRPTESRLLTRELFYTAVTRAQERVRVVGTEAAVRAAVSARCNGPAGWSAAAARGTRGGVVARNRVTCHVVEPVNYIASGGTPMEFGIFTVGDVTTDPTTGRTPTEHERIKATVDDRQEGRGGRARRRRRRPAPQPALRRERARPPRWPTSARRPSGSSSRPAPR